MVIHYYAAPGIGRPLTVSNSASKSDVIIIGILLKYGFAAIVETPAVRKRAV